MKQYACERYNLEIQNKRNVCRVCAIFFVLIIYLNIPESVNITANPPITLEVRLLYL